MYARIRSVYSGFAEKKLDTMSKGNQSRVWPVLVLNHVEQRFSFVCSGSAERFIIQQETLVISSGSRNFLGCETCSSNNRFSHHYTARGGHGAAQRPAMNDRNALLNVAHKDSLADSTDVESFVEAEALVLATNQQTVVSGSSGLSSGRTDADEDIIVVARWVFLVVGLVCAVAFIWSLATLSDYDANERPGIIASTVIAGCFAFIGLGMACDSCQSVREREPEHEPRLPRDNVRA